MRFVTWMTSSLVPAINSLMGYAYSQYRLNTAGASALQQHSNSALAIVMLCILNGISGIRCCGLQTCGQSRTRPLRPFCAWAQARPASHRSAAPAGPGTACR